MSDEEFKRACKLMHEGRAREIGNRISSSKTFINKSQWDKDQDSWEKEHGERRSKALGWL